MKIVLLALVVGLFAIAAWTGCSMGPKGPFCQSCAMPMAKPELFGTEADGSPSHEYCTYCYQKGAFTAPDITMAQMIDLCVKKMVEKNVMPEPQARALMTKYLPQMKRWKKS